MQLLDSFPNDCKVYINVGGMQHAIMDYGYDTGTGDGGPALKSEAETLSLYLVDTRENER